MNDKTKFQKSLTRLNKRASAFMYLAFAVVFSVIMVCMNWSSAVAELDGISVVYLILGFSILIFGFLIASVGSFERADISDQLDQLREKIDDLSV